MMPRTRHRFCRSRRTSGAGRSRHIHPFVIFDAVPMISLFLILREIEDSYWWAIILFDDFIAPRASAFGVATIRGIFEPLVRRQSNKVQFFAHSSNRTSSA